MVNSIIYLFPNAKPLIDFLVADDGEGQYIKYWDTDKLGEKPTQLEIEKVAEASKKIIERESFKVERAAAVQALVVTTAAGNTFDGDEISQGRMARKILVLPEGQTVRWVLHDNTEIDTTAAELREALALAGAEQDRLWVKTE